MDFGNTRESTNYKVPTPLEQRLWNMYHEANKHLADSENARLLREVNMWSAQNAAISKNLTPQQDHPDMNTLFQYIAQMYSGQPR